MVHRLVGVNTGFPQISVQLYNLHNPNLVQCLQHIQLNIIHLFCLAAVRVSSYQSYPVHKVPQNIKYICYCLQKGSNVHWVKLFFKVALQSLNSITIRGHFLFSRACASSHLPLLRHGLSVLFSHMTDFFHVLSRVLPCLSFCFWICFCCRLILLT